MPRANVTLFREGLRALVFLVVASFGAAAFSDTVAVPAGIQANLAAKLLAFDRNLLSRAKDKVRVLVMVDPKEGQSQRIANEFAAGMRSRRIIAGLPVEVTTVTFTNAQDLASRVTKERVAAVYLSSGLVRAAEAIATALKGVEVMTIAAEPAAVIRGISVGFDLLSGQPKILINLSQARTQNIQLPASVLSLALVRGE